MNPLRQIKDDTASLIRDIRRGARHLAWRMSWWRRRKQIDVEKQAAQVENIRRSVVAARKMCRECRALIPASASVCPECGANTASIRAGGVGRALGNAVPFEISVTMILLTCFFVLFLAGLVISARMDEVPGGGGGSPLGTIMTLDWHALFILGANDGRFSGGPEPWRLLTATFLHAGLIHLLFNSWALLDLGRLIEHLYGPRKMFVLYLTTGVLGNVVSLWWHGPGLFQVGASGAIFGLIGVAGVWGLKRGGTVGQTMRQHMTTWALYGIVMGIFFRADNAAHIGGLIAGALAAFVIDDAESRGGPMLERLWSALALVGVLVCLGSFALIAIRWAGPI